MVIAFVSVYDRQSPVSLSSLHAHSLQGPSSYDWEEVRVVPCLQVELHMFPIVEAMHVGLFFKPLVHSLPVLRWLVAVLLLDVINVSLMALSSASFDWPKSPDTSLWPSLWLRLLLTAKAWAGGEPGAALVLPAIAARATAMRLVDENFMVDFGLEFRDQLQMLWDMNRYKIGYSKWRDSLQKVESVQRLRSLGSTIQVYICPNQGDNGSRDRAFFCTLKRGTNRDNCAAYSLSPMVAQNRMAKPSGLHDLSAWTFVLCFNNLHSL